MPPKNMRLENAVLFTQDGQKVGKIEDFEIEAPELTEPPPEYLGNVLHLDPVEMTFELDMTVGVKKILKLIELSVAIHWANYTDSRKNAHLAKYGKNRRIRKKNADICLRRFRKTLKGGKILWQ